MDRRAFTRHSIAGLASVAVSPAVLHAAPPDVQQSRVRGDRLIGKLEAFGHIGADPRGGISRHAFSEADREARRFVAEWMREAGLDVSVDAAANLIGRRAGSTSRQPLVIGSHIDSVPNGGNYDGPVGALAAVEVAHTLVETGTPLRHPLEVIIFSNEEGGKTGSRALAGEVTEHDLALSTASGRTTREGMVFLGGDPDALSGIVRQPGSATAFLELHVEQGDVLERAGVPIGVVEGIVGIRRWNVRVEGFANHAGTTPMNARQDALVAAARWISAVHRIASELPGRQVATVGRVLAEPGAPNVIPGAVVMSLEIRDLDMERIGMVFTQMRDEAAVLGTRNGTRFFFEQFYESRAALTAEPLRRTIENAAAALGFSTLRLPSGAGHDAQSIAQFAPIGMIFVPSARGISHSPEERSRPEHIVAGADVLLHTLLRLDAG